MNSWDAMLATWRDAGLALIALVVVVAGVDRLRKAARRCNEALESVAQAPEQAEPRATIPAQRTGGEHRAW